MGISTQLFLSRRDYSHATLQVQEAHTRGDTFFNVRAGASQYHVMDQSPDAMTHSKLRLHDLGRRTAVAQGWMTFWRLHANRVFVPWPVSLRGPSTASALPDPNAAAAILTASVSRVARSFY